MYQKCLDNELKILKDLEKKKKRKKEKRKNKIEMPQKHCSVGI